MKYFNTVLKSKVKVALFAAAGALTLFTACKDENEDPNKEIAVQFVVKTVDVVILKSVTTQVGTQQSSVYTFTGPNWQSTPQVVNTAAGALHLSSTAMGLKPESRLIAQILIDGKIAVADTVAGSDMTVKVMQDIRPFIP